MNIYIPELEYTFYGPIVFLSIITGMVIACFMMKKSGVKNETILLTAILTFVSIIVCSAVTSIVLSGDIRKVGFVGAGGALGLLIGASASALIHRDHLKESLSAWIIVSPLMYGLSKIGCHIAGCCNGIPYNGVINITYASKGNISYFPIQLTETVVFIVIFIIGIILFFKSDKKLTVASITLLLSAAAKTGLEYLRESHVGIISNYQILVWIIAAAGVIFIRFTGRIINEE